MMFLEIKHHIISKLMGWGLGEHNFSVQIWIFPLTSSKTDLYIGTSPYEGC